MISLLQPLTYVLLVFTSLTFSFWFILSPPTFSWLFLPFHFPLSVLLSTSPQSHSHSTTLPNLSPPSCGSVNFAWSFYFEGANILSFNLKFTFCNRCVFVTIQLPFHSVSVLHTDQRFASPGLNFTCNNSSLLVRCGFRNILKRFSFIW